MWIPFSSLQGLLSKRPEFSSYTCLTHYHSPVFNNLIFHQWMTTAESLRRIKSQSHVQKSASVESSVHYSDRSFLYHCLNCSLLNSFYPPPHLFNLKININWTIPFLVLSQNHVKKKKWNGSLSGERICAKFFISCNFIWTSNERFVQQFKNYWLYQGKIKILISVILMVKLKTTKKLLN